MHKKIDLQGGRNNNSKQHEKRKNEHEGRKKLDVVLFFML